MRRGQVTNFSLLIWVLGCKVMNFLFIKVTQGQHSVQSSAKYFKAPAKG